MSEAQTELPPGDSDVSAEIFTVRIAEFWEYFAEDR